MEVQTVLQMNPGDDETSYANNSSFQKLALTKSRHVMEYILRKTWNHNQLPMRFRMADLACSSGPNALLGISYVIDIILQICHEKKSHHDQVLPEFEVFLNDLPSNDFNHLFKLLKDFHEEKENHIGKRCFVSGLPGSFYNRLFPRQSLHFVSSFSALHWLSKVPDQVNEKNKGNIHLAPSSPLNVFEAYLKQFQSDFSTFLRLRAEEIKIGGLMVLTFLVRTVSDPFMNDTFEYLSLLAKALSEMSHEGVVEEANIDAFNVPMYVACKEEVQAIIQREGSFKVDKLEIFETNCNTTGNNDETIRNIKNNVRAYMEPLLTTHFGTSLTDELFARFEKHVARRVSQGTVSFSDIVIALTRK